MADKMLIDASHPEETRVVVVRKNRIEEFDFESQHKTQLRGNIYLAKVTRVEPSLQAAFVDYGGNRHGFLAFSEIHPDYYQILQSDRQALLEAEAAEAEEARLKEEREAANAKSGHAKKSEPDGEADDLDSTATHTDEDKPKKNRRRRSRRKKNSAAEEAQLEANEASDASNPDDGEKTQSEAKSETGTEIEQAVTSELDQQSPDQQSPDQQSDVIPEPAADSVADENSEGVRSDIDSLDGDKSEGENSDDNSDNDQKPDTMAAIIETEDEISEPVETPGDPDKSGGSEPEQASGEPGENSENTDEAHAETQAETSAETSAEKPKRRRTRRKAGTAKTDAKSDADQADSDSANSESAKGSTEDTDSDMLSDADSDDSDAEDISVEEVGVEDALEEVPETPRKPRKQYRIQEVIKRRQIILVQIVKEERGNKGAALTTYLSLAGRYSVLMPNTARGGGISRKITDMQDRKRLKEVAQELEVPNGMGVILRTAGASRTKTEIRRDFEYLMRLWESVRDLTLKSIAPCLVYEEGSLIKRSVRDLYNKDIGEVIVSGEDGYREAKDFMKMLMPSHAKAVQRYRGTRPIFVNSGIEAQLDQMMSPQVTLKSGGYLIINQTEALVAVDVNSGRSTRESSVEDTALQTNLEAAEEVARQLRLRDLAGLVVIDFIDMEEKRNNRAVEKRLKECLKNDRARIQVGRISHFGLLEMSRQRIRASVLESTTQPCPHCEGTGLIRSDSSFALQILRGIEEQLLKAPRNDVNVRTSTGDALYVLNTKRDSLNELEERFGVTISIHADPSITSQEFTTEKGPQSTKTAKVDPNQLASSYGAADAEMMEDLDVVSELNDIATDSDIDESVEGNQRKRRRRRRRSGRGGSDEQQPHQNIEADSDASQDTSEQDEADSSPQEVEDSETNGDGRPKKRRRRGKRGGRRNRDQDQAETSDSEIEADGSADIQDANSPSDKGEQTDSAAINDASSEAQPEASAELAGDSTEEPPKRPRRRRTKKTQSEEPSGDSGNANNNPDAAAMASPSDGTLTEDINDDQPDAAVKASASRKARTNLEQIASEPVLTSSSGDMAQSDAPKKTGWWRRAFKAE